VKARAALLGVVWTGSALALELEGGSSYERLTNGQPDWKSVYLEGAHTFEPRQTLYGALREVERFDLRDDQVEAGYYHPFSSRLTGHVDGNASPQHNFLARSSLFGELAFELNRGWVASGGYRHNEYTTTNTRIISAGLERYFASYRAYYTLNNGRPENTGSATAHRVGLDYYYAEERSRIGVSVQVGIELRYAEAVVFSKPARDRRFGLWLDPRIQLGAVARREQRGLVHSFDRAQRPQRRRQRFFGERDLFAQGDRGGLVVQA
jgi:YaiO family outer membrane protein